MEQRGTALLQWGHAHRDASLAEPQAAVRAIGRAARPDLVGLAVPVSTTDRDRGIAMVARRCPRWDRRGRGHDDRRRTGATTGGRRTRHRPW